MKNEQFNTAINDAVSRSLALLTVKGDEYAPTGDRLIAFTEAAGLMQCPREQALFGMLAKHLVSVSDMVKDPDKYTLSRWHEKLTDSINYLLILSAMVEERNNEKYSSESAEPLRSTGRGKNDGGCGKTDTARP